MAAVDIPDFWSEESLGGGKEELEVIVDRVDEVDGDEDEGEGEDEDGKSNDILAKVGRSLVLLRSSALLAMLLGSGAPSFLANCPRRFSQHVSLTWVEFRGQKLPSAHLFRRTPELLISNQSNISLISMLTRM